MYCPGCGKNIPFFGDVCPYCQRDNSKAQGYHVMAVCSGLMCGFIGYAIWGVAGAFFGFIGGATAVFVKMGTTKETSPQKHYAQDENEHYQRDTTRDKYLSENLIAFNYVDANGDETYRVVEVNELYNRNGNTYIDGFCRTRNDDRTFRGDRINGGIYVPSSAEMVSPEEYFSANGIEYQDEDAYYDDNYQEPTQYWDEETYVPVEANLKIEYRDRNGTKTTRDIQVSGYDGSSYLHAYCQLRQQRRTFRIEQITSCIDADTGEIVSNLPQHLLDKYRQSPQYSLQKTLEHMADILPVLFYVGKADGQLRAAERRILCALVRKAARDERITDDMVNGVLNGIQIPSPQSFKLAINRICQSSHKNMVFTYKVAKKMVETQKTVHPGEAEAIAYMEKKMAKEGISTQEAPQGNIRKP